MNQLLWNKSRVFILQACSLAIIVTLLYIVLKPQRDAFHELPNLSQWESIDRDEAKIAYHDSEGKKYIEQGEGNLGIEIFLIPVLHGDNFELIKSRLKFELKPEDVKVVEDSNLGSYGLFTKNNSVYLSTCIHSQGKIAFSQQQFSDLVNSNIGDRIIPWMLGLSDIRDWRCFWVNMSVDLENMTEPEAGLVLKQKLSQIVSQSKFK